VRHDPDRPRRRGDQVEPVDGDRTRKLRGFGAGFFGYFNRNKKSLALDADAPEGKGGLVESALFESMVFLIRTQKTPSWCR
jgi:crotonobetainyl-CoA:carnitine CoA-transferase CaiB-like acyl-CoA transferase